MEAQLTYKPPPERIVEISQQEYLERFSSAFRIYQDAGLDPRLIGALGRQASINMSNPNLRRPDNTLRDIDITVLGLKEGEDTRELDIKAQRIASPIGFDTFNGLFYQDSSGKEFIKYKDIQLEIDPQVTKVRDGSLGGLHIPTFDPNTLFHLSALFLGMRHKDKLDLLRFGRQLREMDSILPEELFGPFHTLLDMKHDLYPKDVMVAHLQYWYSKYIPSHIRKAIHPLAGQVRKALA